MGTAPGDTLVLKFAQKPKKMSAGPAVVMTHPMPSVPIDEAVPVLNMTSPSLSLRAVALRSSSRSSLGPVKIEKKIFGKL